MANKDKIIIIDDDPNILHVLSIMLKSSGYQVSTTQDPSQGIELVKQLCPAVVLVDYIMPELDGPEVSRQIIEMGIGSQVIMMTGYVDPSKAIRAIQAGASDYIHKPIVDQKHLLGPIRSASTRYHRWRSVVMEAFRISNQGKEPT